MNVLTKNIENRNQAEFVSLEQMVPANYLLRQFDSAIDFKRIYEFVGDLISTVSVPCAGHGKRFSFPKVPLSPEMMCSSPASGFLDERKNDEPIFRSVFLANIASNPATHHFAALFAEQRNPKSSLHF